MYSKILDIDGVSAYVNRQVNSHSSRLVRNNTAVNMSGIIEAFEADQPNDYRPSKLIEMYLCEPSQPKHIEAS